MQKQILQTLESIEEEHEVKVLYACESGSRAWGFSSADSDYDVRFLYLRPPKWYVSIDLESKRDVIELPLEDNLDVNGWDLRKALQQFSKSNPPLYEWLGSPIVYLEEDPLAERMRELAPLCYSPKASMYHYYNMAEGNYGAYLKGDEVKLKKYFYVLRPVLCVNWLEKDMGIVPTEFQDLVDGLVDSTKLKDAIYHLLELKRAGDELDVAPSDPVISEFLDKEMARLELVAFEKPSGNCSQDVLDDLFRLSLNEVWGENSLFEE